MQNLFWHPLKIYCALLQTQHYVNDFVNDWINFLEQEVIKVRQTVLYGLYSRI